MAAGRRGPLTQKIPGGWTVGRAIRTPATITADQKEKVPLDLEGRKRR